MNITKLVLFLFLTSWLGVACAGQPIAPWNEQPASTFTTANTPRSTISCIEAQMLRKGWPVSVVPLDQNSEVILAYGPLGIVGWVKAEPSATDTTVSFNKHGPKGGWVNVIKECI